MLKIKNTSRLIKILFGIFIFLLFACFILLSYDVYGEYKSKKNLEHRVKMMRNLLDSMEAKLLQDNSKTLPIQDYNGVQSLNINAFKSLDEPEIPTAIRDQIIGQIIIPSIELNYPILNGTNNLTLNYGITTMRIDQKMGQGNYPLAGHHASNGLFFGELDKIKGGDTIIITDKDQVYSYIVTKVLTVEPAALDMLSDEQADLKPIISLMTCQTVDYLDSHRLFIIGTLEKEEPYSKK